MKRVVAFVLAMFIAACASEDAACDYGESPGPVGQACAAQEDCRADGACFDSRCLAGVCVVGVFVAGTPCDACDTIKVCNGLGACVDPIAGALPSGDHTRAP